MSKIIHVIDLNSHSNHSTHSNHVIILKSLSAIPENNHHNVLLSNGCLMACQECHTTTCALIGYNKLKQGDTRSQHSNIAWCNVRSLNKAPLLHSLFNVSTLQNVGIARNNEVGSRVTTKWVHSRLISTRRIDLSVPGGDLRI